MSGFKGWKVVVWEFERGWGRRVDFVERFEVDDYDKAKKFSDDFNAKNTEPTAPDWYMQASVPMPIIE